ncbi:MAG: hypothetical protein H6707_17325 [Deltaproteobacteria bacterium]|nr:hypothetical protein [Deltaproteobacteria bacterium]
MNRRLIAIAIAAVIGQSGLALAGGYDTPMLYSARHMGMGGAANAYVNDPSALFHNPAGLAGIKKLSLLGDFSLLLGGITASPELSAQSKDSKLVKAPFFLIGAGYRLTDWLVLGAAVYPVASASAEYEYNNNNKLVKNSTKLVFIETTVGAAVNLEAIRLKIGAGYRLTFVNLVREQVTEGAPAFLDFNMAGWNLASFRVGAQWEAIKDHLSLGVSYRHKTVTDITQDKFKALGFDAIDGQANFTLPARLIFGVRGDYGRFGAAVDLEYALNSQNDVTVLSGKLNPNDPPTSLENIYDWDNAITLRLGGEYRIPWGKSRRIIPRLGFVYDARTAKKAYPSAFGTPPAPTFVLTAGAGYESGPYRINLAYGYRFGSTTITPEDLQKATKNCQLCGQAGDYSIFLNGIYLDVSYDFE